MRLFTPPNKEELTAGFCGEKMEAGTMVGATREDMEVCSMRDAGALLGENIACRCIAVSSPKPKPNVSSRARVHV